MKKKKKKTQQKKKKKGLCWLGQCPETARIDGQTCNFNSFSLCIFCFFNFFIFLILILIIYLLIIEHVFIMCKTRIPLAQYIVTNSYIVFHILYVMEREGRSLILPCKFL